MYVYIWHIYIHLFLLLQKHSILLQKSLWRSCGTKASGRHFWIRMVCWIRCLPTSLGGEPSFNGPFGEGKFGILGRPKNSVSLMGFFGEGIHQMILIVTSENCHRYKYQKGSSFLMAIMLFWVNVFLGYHHQQQQHHPPPPHYFHPPILIIIVHLRIFTFIHSIHSCFSIPCSWVKKRSFKFWSSILLSSCWQLGHAGTISRHTSWLTSSLRCPLIGWWRRCRFQGRGLSQFLSQKVLLTSTASPLPFSSPELPPLQTGFEHGLCQSQQHCRENCSIALEPLITAMLRHSFKSCRNGNGIMQTEMRTHSNQSRVKTLNSQGQQWLSC